MNIIEKMGAAIASVMMLAVIFSAVMGMKVSAETTECPTIRSLNGLNVRRESVDSSTDYVVHIYAEDGCEHTIYIDEADLDAVSERLNAEDARWCVLAPPAFYEPAEEDVVETTSQYYFKPSNNLN